MLKHLLIFSLCLILGTGLSIGYLIYRDKTQNRQLPPEKKSALLKTPFSLEKAPLDSLRGEVGTISGQVLWQSRTATEGAKIFAPQPIQQGESVETGNTGRATMVFPNSMSVLLSPKTHLDVIQTLPANVVFAQISGLAMYSNPNPNPLSVRSFDLLVNFATASGTITINSGLERVYVTPITGTIQAAFEDANYNTIVKTIPTGDELIFDHNSLTGYVY